MKDEFIEVENKILKICNNRITPAFDIRVSVWTLYNSWLRLFSSSIKKRRITHSVSKRNRLTRAEREEAAKLY